MNQPRQPISKFRILMLCWFIANVYTTYCGVSEYNYKHTTSNCDEPRRRVDYVMPGYKLGCWLAK